MTQRTLGKFCGYLWVLLPFIFTGCSDTTPPPHINVSGQVLNDNGQPLAGIQVYFWATEQKQDFLGRYGSAVTDVNGNFRLTSSAGIEGIAAGEYKVTFTSAVDAATKLAVKESEGGAEPSSGFSDVYSSLENTPIVAVVAEDSPPFRFELKSD